MTSILLLLALVLALVALVLGLRRPAHRPDGVNRVPPAPAGTREEFAAELAPKLPPPAESPPSPAPPDLPRNYGVDRLVLMARDPSWLFAYWEISATRQDNFDREYGPRAWQQTRPALRVYDVTGVAFDGANARRVFDIGLAEETDNWHITVGEQDRSFMVDLGRVFPNGRFVTLLRSNVVQTPRASLSDRTDEDWMWIEGLYRSMRMQLGTSSPLIIEEMAARQGEIPFGVSSPFFPGKEG